MLLPHGSQEQLEAIAHERCVAAHNASSAAELATTAHNEAAKCAIAAADVESRAITAAKAIVVTKQAGLAQQRRLAEVTQGAARALVVDHDVKAHLDVRADVEAHVDLCINVVADVKAHVDVLADACKLKELELLTALESIRAAFSVFAGARGFEGALLRAGNIELFAAKCLIDEAESALMRYRLAEARVKDAYQSCLKTHDDACRQIFQLMSVMIDLARPKDQDIETVATGQPNAATSTANPSLAAVTATPRELERLFVTARLASQQLASAEAHAAVAAFQTADAFADTAAHYWRNFGKERGGPSKVYEKSCSSDSSMEDECEKQYVDRSEDSDESSMEYERDIFSEPDSSL
jgi:hypothetical protein